MLQSRLTRYGVANACCTRRDRGQCHGERNGGRRVTQVPASDGHEGGSSNRQPLGVVVISVEQSRLTQYRAALRMAGVTAALTDNVDEAEDWLRDRLPAALILDQGLPRMTVLRLYGLVRGEESMQGIAVLFVGQEGSGSAEDHYLSADASPLMVAAEAQRLAAFPDQAEPADEEEVEAPARKRPAAPPEAVTIDAEAVPVVREEPPAVAPAPSGRRLDVMLFRVGIALLILGVAAIWLRPESSPSTLAAPTVVPATPTRPPASPSPAAFLGVEDARRGACPSRMF